MPSCRTRRREPAQSHRLASYTIPASGQNPARTTEFRYDASGVRVQRLGPDGDTVYVGGVFEQSGTDTKTYYSFAGATVAVRDKTPSSDDRYYLVSDLVGTNSMQIKYERTGGSHDRCAQYYFPYGAKRASWDNTSGSGSAVTDRGYTGQVSDSALTGLLFYNARYYDPALRRLISADTIVPNPGNPQDLNRYSYVGNNPTTYSDPSGHCTTRNGLVIDGDSSHGCGDRYVNGCWYNHGTHQCTPGDPLDTTGGYIGPKAPSEAGHSVVAQVANGLIDFVPIVGDLKGIVEAIRGRDALGQELSWWERGLSLFGASELRNADEGAEAVAGIFGWIKRKIGAGGDAANGLSARHRALALQNITDSGDTVLGRYPGYITKANSRGASYFDIGDEWGRLADQGIDPWALNVEFLETIAARGDRVLLSVPKGKIPATGPLRDEVNYLVDELDYVWVNQWSLRPGG